MLARVLITGIGNIGKSTLREKVCKHFPYVIGVDRDYESESPAIPDEDRVLLVESVHGLEEHPERFDLIIYLLPPLFHCWRWVKRGWAWWRSGVVDLSDPKGIRKPFAIGNVPIICSIMLENIVNRKKWIREDLTLLKEKNLMERTWIGYPDDAFRFLVKILSR